MATVCQQFLDVLSRRAEHLDEPILRDVTPSMTLIGYVETGTFNAADGVSHTFDKFNRVFPDLSRKWDDVEAGSCIGAPCDPEDVKIGMGFTRDMYKLQRINYGTDIYCFDKDMTADRVKEQFDHTVANLRDATTIIMDNRIRNALFRTAGHHWACTMTGLVPITFQENGTDLIDVDVSVMPTSKLVTNMLKSRLQYQMINGALGKTVKGVPPKLEVLSDLDTVWNLCKGDTTLSDHWRFDSFDVGSKEYSQYGWAAQVGNFMLHADFPQRFEIVGPTKLRRVFPYVNINATRGIKGIVNQAYIDAPVQASYIHHRRSIIVKVLNSMSINPMMPYAARDFGGKWKFVMDNLSCGTAIAKDAAGADIEVPIMVPNPHRNKGQFKAEFKNAIEAQFPEYEEMFLHLIEPPCIVGEPLCSTPYYVEQSYSSANEPCP